MKQLQVTDDALVVTLRNSPPFDQVLERETLLRLAMRCSTRTLIHASEFLRQCAEARKPIESNEIEVNALDGH